MYSDKYNVNILTALLVKHGIRHAVVCPGSRNSPIVHNLNECPDISCYPVTDERSAAFYALGMTQALKQPVVVCVTSGTALLNVLPAVAEAYYQHRPLVVISADRPAQWIDQLDGQTLPQPDALGRFVEKAVTLPEPHDEEEQWYCNRLVNEALLWKRGPVHINVPISEPLFNYTVTALPDERLISLTPAVVSNVTLSHVCRMFLQAKRPMLISGQPMNPLMDEAVMEIGEDESYVPDFVLYTDGSIVSKRLKRFLRKAKETWAVNREGEVNDTFMNLTHVVQGDPDIVADMIRFNLEEMPHPFVQKWEALLAKLAEKADAEEPDYSQAAVVKYLEERLSTDAVVHYANSTAIRLANVYARHHVVYCNRGVNGIEGSLSTAAGFSVVTDERVFCVIGDLSFFYDQNALWNQNLRGNLRILLLNNGKGGIFNMLKGLEKSPARDRFIAAAHQTTAEGICQQNDIYYLSATTMEDMKKGVEILLSSDFSRPVVLEVFTS
ncbi:MAG: 2-succinyl-5-enolpyruvyl-6-hydroxy-3-cyclohexene-1-carboxylic-acid synthase [Prevotella sp.]|nr:2-succinyl-5-enolpyruvyl-6-hydroxy-3-cyclohexene-1-carboxylic-acid synthase [Prevotella sp.]